MGSSWKSRIICGICRQGVFPVAGVLCACCAAALPTRAQELPAEEAPAQPAPIRSTRSGGGGRLPLEKMVRDALFGISWSRVRLPMNVALHGNPRDDFSIRLTLSRRDFSGATFQFRF